MQFGKLKFLMTDLESNIEINCAHIDFSKIILHLNIFSFESNQINLNLLSNDAKLFANI
jgi:hypothetical protein